MKVKVCVELEVIHGEERPFEDLQDSLSAYVGVMFEGLSEIKSDDFDFEYTGNIDVEEVK
jgi:hypothetical protein